MLSPVTSSLAGIVPAVSSAPNGEQTGAQSQTDATQAADLFILSEEAEAELLTTGGSQADTSDENTQDGEGGDTQDPTRETDESGEPLSDEEQRQLEELRNRDREVRAHEQAHVAAAGGLAQGGPSYEYEKGPDGKQYAVGGHVNINTSEGRTPEETIQRMQTVKRAALAPAEPSGQDRKVASEAAAKEAKARQELNAERAEEAKENQPSAQTEKSSESNGVGASEQIAEVSSSAPSAPSGGVSQLNYAQAGSFAAIGGLLNVVA